MYKLQFAKVNPAGSAIALKALRSARVGQMPSNRIKFAPNPATAPAPKDPSQILAGRGQV